MARKSANEGDPIQRLQAFLNEQDPGGVDRKALMEHLGPAWPTLEGGDETAMDSRKLDRIEEPMWSPPILSFEIERHGAVVAGGSTRGEVQMWEVDMVNKTVSVVRTRVRQLRPMAARLDLKAMADEIVAVIESAGEDASLVWSPDHRTVKIKIGEIIPAELTFKETLTSRRRTFRKYVEVVPSLVELESVVPRLAPAGW